jgi:hypothetical protein
MTPIAKVYIMIIPIHTILTFQLDSILCHLVLVDLVHIIQIRIEYLSKLCYILFIVSFCSPSVEMHYTIAHMSRIIQIHYHL